MLQAERVAEYLQSRYPQATEIAVENVFRIAGGAPYAVAHTRQARSFGAHWREGMGILERLVIGPHAPTGLTGLADGAGVN